MIRLCLKNAEPPTDLLHPSSHPVFLACVSLWAFLGLAAAHADVASSQPGEPAADTEAPAVREADLESQASLDLVIQYAVGHNPSIVAARHEWEAACQHIRVAKSYQNPMVTFSPDTGRMAETRAGPQGNAVGLSQAIPFPGKLGLQGRVADEQAGAAYERLQAVVQEVSRQTRAVYADYYLAGKSLDTNREITDLMQEFSAIAAAKYGVGTAAQQDVIMAHERLSRLAVERQVFQGGLATALGTLNALLDRSPRAVIPNPAVLQAYEVTAKLDTLLEWAGEARPELKSQEHLIQASRRSLGLAKRGYLPDFTVGGQYIEVMGGTNPGFAEDGQDIWMVNLGFSIPIWINRVKADVREKQASVMREESLQRDLTNRVYDQVQRAYERARVAADTERIFRTTLVPQTEERVAAARAGYQTGLVDFLTLIDSLKSLEGVQLDLYRSVRDSQQAVADLERAVGQPVSSFAEPAGGGS